MPHFDLDRYKCTGRVTKITASEYRNTDDVVEVRAYYTTKEKIREWTYSSSESLPTWWWQTPLDPWKVGDGFRGTLVFSGTSACVSNLERVRQQHQQGS